MNSLTLNVLRTWVWLWLTFCLYFFSCGTIYPWLWALGSLVKSWRTEWSRWRGTYAKNTLLASWPPGVRNLQTVSFQQLSCDRAIASPSRFTCSVLILQIWSIETDDHAARNDRYFEILEWRDGSCATVVLIDNARQSVLNWRGRGNGRKLAYTLEMPLIGYVYQCGSH